MEQDESKKRHKIGRQYQRNNTISRSIGLDRERDLYNAKVEVDSSNSPLSSIDSGRNLDEDDAQVTVPSPEAHQTSSSAFRRQQANGYTNIAETWTKVTADQGFVNHLLALYFCWEYPIFASFSKLHFLHDFRSGRRRFCSSLLLNVILSLACRFSCSKSTTESL